mgnify:FL=1
MLARCLAAGRHDPEIALARYDRIRSPRTRVVMAASAVGADRIQASRPDASRNEDALGIFAYDPGNVAMEAPA